MVCSCCGSSKHNLRGCPLPGSKRLRELADENRRLRRAAPNPQEGRRPRKFGVNQWGSFGRKSQHRKQASLAYSGKQAQQLRKRKDRERRLKTSPMPSNPALEIAAVEELQKLGFLNSCPRRCPHCRGTLRQWSVRNGAEACSLLF